MPLTWKKPHLILRCNECQQTRRVKLGARMIDILDDCAEIGWLILSEEHARCPQCAGVENDAPMNSRPEPNLTTPEGVRQLRYEFDMSQAEFAKYLGIPERTLASWERGERTPSQPSIALLKKAGGYR